MKLIADHTGKITKLETRLGEMTLEQAFRHALQQDGRAITRLEADACLGHNNLGCLNYPSCKTKPTLNSYMQAFIEMGYDVTIEKRHA